MRIPKGVKLRLALCLRCDAHHKKALFHREGGFTVGREQDQSSAVGRSNGGCRLRGCARRTADQRLNCRTFILDTNWVHELFAVEAQHKQPYGG